MPYCGSVLDLSAFDLEMIGSALGDQNDYDRAWVVDPRTGETIFWTDDTGIDGETPVELDELDMIVIRPLPSRVWYEDMVDFAERVTDSRAQRRLLTALEGKGAFRRFKDELHRGAPQLVQEWYAFRDARAHRRAVEWLLDQELISQEAAARYYEEHPDPASEPTEPQHAEIYLLIREGPDQEPYPAAAFESELEAQKVLEFWGRTERMTIANVPLYETAEEWQADR
jgi:hypothetical protein